MASRTDRKPRDGLARVFSDRSGTDSEVPAALLACRPGTVPPRGSRRRTVADHFRDVADRTADCDQVSVLVSGPQGLFVLGGLAGQVATDFCIEVAGVTF